MRTLFFVFCILLFVSHNFPAKAQDKDHYQLTGHLVGLKEGEKVTMKLSYGYDFHDLISQDSAFVKNGEFKIVGIAPAGPRSFWMVFSGHNSAIRCCINNGENITVSCAKDIGEIPHTYLENWVSWEGDRVNKLNRMPTTAFLFYVQLMNLYRNDISRIRDSVGFDQQLVSAIMEKRETANFYFYSSVLVKPDYRYDIVIPGCIVGNKIMEWSEHSQIIPKIYNDLMAEQKESFYGKKLKLQAALCVGQPFPEFNLPTPENKILSLKEVVSKNKMTIIHFWGSLSDADDLKNSDKALQVFYKKYHDKGLNIIGISADTKPVIWKAWVEEGKYPWYNVSDLKGWQKGSIIQDTYQEGGHTKPNVTDVILDEQGKIVAWVTWNASGVDIALQWYLTKKFGN